VVLRGLEIIVARLLWGGDLGTVRCTYCRPTRTVLLLPYFSSIFVDVEEMVEYGWSVSWVLGSWILDLCTYLVSSPASGALGASGPGSFCAGQKKDAPEPSARHRIGSCLK